MHEILGITVLVLCLAALSSPIQANPVIDEAPGHGGPIAAGGDGRSNDCPGSVVWDTGMYDEFTPMFGTGVNVGCFVNAINDGGHPTDGRRLADDWTSNGRPITHVKTWARYDLSGYAYHLQNPGSLHGFCVKFYEARENPPWCPDGTGVGELAIGDIIYSEYASDFVEYEITTGLARNFNYCITLPVPFRPIADRVYWVSVSADFDFVLFNGDMTQWFNRLYWGVGNSACEAAWWDTWNFPPTEWNAVSAATNNPYWTGWDMAFVLYSPPLPPPTGACCLLQDQCRVLPANECQGKGGLYLGDDVECVPRFCPTASIVAWGDNDSGQCDVPAPNADFTAVAAGTWHSLGLKSDGTIAAWGSNLNNQCNVPGPNADFVAAAGGGFHSLGLKSDGRVAAWGWNLFGQCQVPAPNAGFTAIAAGFLHSLGVKSDGTIVAWGDNDNGKCDVPAPNASFTAVAGGWYHSLGLKSDGSVVAWGGNGSGQCSVPAPNTDFVAIAAGVVHSLGLKSNGMIVAWGSNHYGQCNIPPPNADFHAISSIGFHNLALKSVGKIVAWGSNEWGQCAVPAANAGFLGIAAGGGQSLGLRTLELSAVEIAEAWAEVRDHEVVLRWSEPVGVRAVSFHVYRSNAGDLDGGIGMGDRLTTDRLTSRTGGYEFVDATIRPDQDYLYRLEMHGGPSGPVVRTIPVHVGDLSPAFGIHAVHPHPVSGPATIVFRIPRKGHVALDLVDVVGRRLWRLVDADLEKGVHNAAFDPRRPDTSGRPLPAGVYHAVLRFNGRVEAERIVVVP